MMIRLYKGGQVSPLLYEVDARDWVQGGWSRKPPTESSPVPSPAPTPKPTGSNPARATREAELMALLPDNWRSVRRIAQDLGIEKPDGGWDESIPMILDKEFP